MKEIRATVIIPAFNEAGQIARTVRAAMSIPGVCRVVVVDDGSTDKTGEIAENAGAWVVHSPRNLGKGGALNLGLPKMNGDYLLLLDADLGLTAIEGEKLLAEVTGGRVDLAIGSFPPGQAKRGFGLFLAFARRVVWKLTGLELSSPLSGQRAMNKRALEGLGWEFAAGFGVEVAMIIDLARKDLRIKEIPVQMADRLTKKDLTGFIHRGKQFLDVVGVVFRRLI